jgi:hypothetical protein
VKTVGLLSSGCHFARCRVSSRNSDTASNHDWEIGRTQKLGIIEVAFGDLVVWTAERSTQMKAMRRLSGLSWTSTPHVPMRSEREHALNERRPPISYDWAL